MTSLQTSLKQIPIDFANFIAIASLTANSSIKLFYDNGAGTGQGVFSNAQWPGSSSNLSTVFSQSGVVLRDMGRTVVSSGLTFRKVQYVHAGYNQNNANVALQTFGVDGPADTTAANGTNLSGFYTGYIQLGLGGGTQAPVARV